MKIVIILFLSIVSFSKLAYSAEREDVLRVINLIESSTTQGIIDRKEKGNTINIVFISNGFCYSIHYSKINRFLSVWINPENSSNKARLETFTDKMLDGRVNFGVICHKGSDKTRKFFKYEGLVYEGENGNKYEIYWQEKYDRAISDALVALK